MTEYRQLTKEEKIIYDRQLSDMESEEKYQEYLRELTNLILNKGLRLDYERAIRKHVLELRQIENNVKDIEFRRKPLLEHLKKGVEIKKEEKKNG